MSSFCPKWDIRGASGEALVAGVPISRDARGAAGGAVPGGGDSAVPRRCCLTSPDPGNVLTARVPALACDKYRQKSFPLASLILIKPLSVGCEGEDSMFCGVGKPRWLQLRAETRWAQA